MYALLTISHHDKTQFHSFVEQSNFLDPLLQYIMLLGTFNLSSEQVCVRLDV